MCIRIDKLTGTKKSHKSAINKKAIQRINDQLHTCQWDSWIVKIKITNFTRWHASQKLENASVFYKQKKNKQTNPWKHAWSFNYNTALGMRTKEHEIHVNSVFGNMGATSSKTAHQYENVPSNLQYLQFDLCTGYGSANGRFNRISNMYTGSSGILDWKMYLHEFILLVDFASTEHMR